MDEKGIRMASTIDASTMTTEALESYDDMMQESAMKVGKFALLASLIWSDVLKELDKRGRVRLVSGSYDDIGNSIFQRVRD
ncbi:hypothetical protein SAMN05428936_101871 [Pelagibacterium halotolerans]|nr:hypothetical protein SAMN05428936_101871 [Pelagibacterium halotolerans]